MVGGCIVIGYMLLGVVLACGIAQAQWGWRGIVGAIGLALVALWLCTLDT